MRGKLILMLLFVLALAMTAAAQEKISGTANCAKPDPMNSIDVGDKAGHAYTLGKAACTWSKPLEIAGLQTKDGASVIVGDMSGNASHIHGTHTSNMANGDKFSCSFQGTTMMKDGKPVSDNGKWTFTIGTGKLRGIKGGGTYKGTPNADGSVTYAVEGEYTLAPPPPPKKK